MSKFRVPSVAEVKKFLGSLVAVAGALVTFGVTGTTAHVVSLVSTAAASLLVFMLKNDPAPATDPATDPAAPATDAAQDVSAS